MMICSIGTTATAMLASLAATGDKRSLTIQVAVSKTETIGTIDVTKQNVFLYILLKTESLLLLLPKYHTLHESRYIIYLRPREL